MAKGLYFVFGLIFILCSLNYVATIDMADDENKMGMESLYDMVHFFLGDIVQTKNISESFLNLSTVFANNKFDDDQITDWKAWANYGKGYAAGACVGFLFIIVMPIVGLVFCCCRLCGKCGGKPRVHDTRRSKCKRRTYCTLIVVFNTLALAGVICAFMCSHLIHEALKNENDEGTIGHIRESLSNINNFTDMAVKNVSSTVMTTYSAVADMAISNISKTGIQAVDIVLDTLNATRHLDKAKEISKTVNATKGQLDTVGGLLEDLSQKSNQLKQNLSSISSEIKRVCDASRNCANFDEKVYDTEADFSSLDELKDEANKVSATMDMSRWIKEAEDGIEKAKSDTNASIETTVDVARKSIVDINKTITDGLNDLKEQRSNTMNFYSSTDKDLKDIDDDIKDGFSDYVFYGCVAVSCVYLLIVILYYLGIVFGLCGERPGHDAPCCNRGTGANFLMAGVSFTFIFSWILMLLCTVLFIIGGISYTEVCRYFDGHDSSNFKVFDETLNNGLDLSKTLYPNHTDLKFSLSKSLRDCQENKAIYSAFKMDYIVNLDKIIDIKPLKNELDKFKKSDLKINNITIISRELEDELKDFSEAGIQNISFNRYFTELNKNLTKVELSQLYLAVKELAKGQSDPDYKETLNKQAERLNTLKENVIPELETDVMKLNLTVQELKKGSDITGSIMALIDDLKSSEKYFNGNKEKLVQKQLDEVAFMILDQTNTSVTRLKTKIRTDIARCQPLSDSLYSVSDSVCVLLVDPVNGLWFSFGWCLFFFVLCLIFGVLLTGEYRHEYKYGKEFDDPFDGRNHDMMPLTSHSVMDRSGRDPMHHQQQQHLYQVPMGVHNSAYSPDIKRSQSSAPPPPYGQHMQPGIAAYASSTPPPDYIGHQHHDLASAYPALNRGGNPYPAGGSKSSYSYPY